MGFFDKLFGRGEEQRPPQRQQPQGYGNAYTNQYGNQQGAQLTDEQAVERYRYMLKTAPPEAIEQAHAEAFAQLTQEQRRMALQQLSANLPESERGMATDDPQSLARVATRAEMRQPGTIERTFSGMGGVGGGGMGMGGLMAGSFFSSMAGMFVGSMIANQFFGGGGYDQGYAEGQQDAQGADGADSNADSGDYGDAGGDSAGNDFGGGDFGGGDFGGDFG